MVFILQTSNIGKVSIVEIRPLKYLVEYRDKYPDCWKHFDQFRNDRGISDWPDWPNWCFCPLAGAYAIISKGSMAQELHFALDVGKLGALAAWRVSQGIYRFDKDVFSSLINTEINKLSLEVFYRLPEWCVYIEAPLFIKFLGCQIFGFFFHLEYDVNKNTTELRFVLDSVNGLSAVPLHFKESLVEAIHDTYETSKSNNTVFFPEISLPDIVADEQARDLMPLLSLVLYLCSENQDTLSNNKQIQPGNRFPAPKKTKQGCRYFPPKKPLFYEVGFNIGKSLRNQFSDSFNSYSHSGPRPHIRRAHWHTFLAGPRNSVRERRIKWLPPISVAVNGTDEIIPKILNVD